MCILGTVSPLCQFRRSSIYYDPKYIQLNTLPTAMLPMLLPSSPPRVTPHVLPKRRPDAAQSVTKSVAKIAAKICGREMVVNNLVYTHLPILGQVSVASGRWAVPNISLPIEVII